LKLPPSNQGWNQASIEHLRALAAPPDAVRLDDLWRGQLTICLMELEQVEDMLRKVEEKLDAIAKDNAQVHLLRSIPGVGARLSELVVAIIDDPHRFANARQVASYAGLTPKQYQSGELTIQGKIGKQGDGLLRVLLVEVSWLGLRHNPWVGDIFTRTNRGIPQRNKLAIIAVARRLLVRC
jgi:transposase